ncbi:DUF6350 family protein [Polymorphospora rubra]|uniref:cell division protein PerM n=1 Tax=Polymorphospora rubra TaxID=338584 RepID=UPI0033F7C9CA
MAASTPDQPSRADGAEEPFPADLGGRQTEPIDVGNRRTEPIDVGNRRTERIDVGNRTTEPIDVGNRPTVRLPTQRSGGVRRGGRAPIVVAAAVATLWAALVSYFPVAVVMGLAQLAEDAATWTGAARVGLAAWLLGHGVPLETGAGSLGLAPMALAALAAWRVSRAGVHVSRAIGARNHGSPRQALTVAVVIGCAYGLIGALAALAVTTDSLAVSPLRAAANLAVFGALAALVGALRTTGALRVVARRLPAPLRHGIRTGVVAALLLLGAGAGAAGLAVATGGGDASSMIQAYRAGVAGQAGITLVSVAYAPNAAVWASAYLLGPGFAVGADTVVRTTEVTVGALPAIPLIAGLPHGPVGGYGAALLTVPVFAGMAAGWLLARRRLRSAARDRTPLSWKGLLGAAAIGGPVAGFVLGAAATVSGGPVGGGRLVEVGPVGWQVAVVATVVVAVGTVVGAAATRVFTGN